MENQAHHRDRLDASFCVVSLFLHESKCSFFLTDPRECEGYLYPPKKIYGGGPRLKVGTFLDFITDFQKLHRCSVQVAPATLHHGIWLKSRSTTPTFG